MVITREVFIGIFLPTLQASSIKNKGLLFKTVPGVVGSAAMRDTNAVILTTSSSSESEHTGNSTAFT